MLGKGPANRSEFHNITKEESKVKVELEVTDGPVKGKKFVFKEHGTFLVGRSAEAHLRFSYDEDPYISRRHFLMEINPPECQLQDLGSTNGTKINGEEVTKLEWHELKDGDSIEIGFTTLQVGIKELIRCARCGKELKQAKQGEDVLCAECRKKQKQAEEKAKVERAVKCVKCGRIIPPDEVKRGETPICYECANRDAAALLEEILKGIALRRREPEVAKGAPAVPGYEITKCLGRGAMGAVWLAKDKKSGELVAIKTMLPQVAKDEHALKEFKREIDITAKLRHPHLVRFITHGVSRGQFYFVMEYVEGTDAQKLLEARGGQMDPREAIPITLQVLEALEYAHEQGIVHRDIKPSQILLAESGDGWEAKLSDYGLGKNFQLAGLSGMTVPGTFGGTAPFMPPEQIIDYRFVKPPSDIFAVGATLYHLLTGQFVFDIRRPREWFLDILEGKPVPIRKRSSAISESIAKVVDKAVSKNIADRYQNAHQMKVDLDKTWQQV